jgi:hypothetical protein
MGKEWSMAVKKIFSKKYSNGRGKLSDAMKDPETKIVHAELLGKKPSKSKGKTLKNKKLGGQPKPASESDPERDPMDISADSSDVSEMSVDTPAPLCPPGCIPDPNLPNVDQPGGKQKSTKGGKKSKKSKKNSSKKERSKSFRKKNCGW